MRKLIFTLCILSLLLSALPIVSLAAGDWSLDGQLDNVLATQSALDAHVEYIRSELRRYDESEDYFEKYGISISIRNYVSDNSLSNSSAEIKELVKINEDHIAELLSKEDEYDLLLNENAAIFVSKCNELKNVSDYYSMVKICEELRYYFFNMDVSYSKVQDSIRIYEEKLVRIEELEENAIIFVNKVSLLKRNFETGDKLALILNAYNAFDDVDLGVSGVGEALLELESFMAKYDELIATQNSELSLTREAVSYMRNYSGKSSFVTLILNAIK